MRKEIVEREKKGRLSEREQEMLEGKEKGEGGDGKKDITECDG